MREQNWPELSTKDAVGASPGDILAGYGKVK